MSLVLLSSLPVLSCLLLLVAYKTKGNVVTLEFSLTVKIMSQWLCLTSPVLVNTGNSNFGPVFACGVLNWSDTLCRISWTQIEVRLSLLDHLFIVSIHQDRFHCRSLDVDWLVLTQSLCFLFCCSSVMLFILLFQLWNMLSQQWNNKSCCDWAIGLPVILYLLVPRRFYRWMLMLSYQNDTDLPDDLSSLA